MPVRIASEYVATEPPETQRCENERSTRSVYVHRCRPRRTDEQRYVQIRRDQRTPGLSGRESLFVVQIDAVSAEHQLASQVGMSVPAFAQAAAAASRNACREPTVIQHT